MCPQELIYLGLVPRFQRENGFNSYKPVTLILLVLFFSLAYGSAFGQNKSEDYLAVKNWQLPQNALAFSELTLKNDVQMYKEKPFTGLAYERFSPVQLSRAVYYVNGRQNGLMLLWYPDGAPQMSANYRDGVLNGRFLGWYQNGGVIYDMVINKGTYAGDNLAEGDDSRSTSETLDAEGEGSDNDKSAE
jgi:antitoxin component YwqK of YwqJK toxin-antitoxin module